MKITRFKDPTTKRWKFKTDVTVAGERHRPVADSADELYDEIDAIKRRARQRRYGLPVELEAVTLKRLVQERTRDLDTDGNKNHRRVKTVLEHFRDRLGPLKIVDQMTAADLLAFKRSRLEEFWRERLRPMAPNSINRELEYVAAMFNLAGRYFPSLEAWKHPRVPYEPTGERGRERPWTEDEERRILEELRAPRARGEKLLAVANRLTAADLAETALNSGMRRGELRKLKVSYVDWRADLVRLPAHVTKKKKARDVPLNDTTRGILRRRAEASKCGLVFTNAEGTGPLNESAFYRCLKAAAGRAKVPYGRSLADGFTFHDTRHTATTRMLDSGAPLGAVSEVVGHSKRTMTLIYDHPPMETKRRAVESLGRKRGGGEKADGAAG